MGYRASIQIILIVMSVVIIVTFINPQFQEVRAIQVQAVEYQEALENATSFRDELSRSQQKADNITPINQDIIDTYLPVQVDQVLVMRTLQNIVEINEMILNQVASVGSQTIVVDGSMGQNGAFSGANSGSDDLESAADEVAVPGGSDTLVGHRFELGVTGTYQQFKSLLFDLERNEYPLEVISAKFSASPVSQDNEDTAANQLLSFSLVVETYDLSDITNQ